MGHCVTGAAVAAAIFRFHADKIARHTHTQHYARITEWVEATNNAFIIIIFEWSVCLIVIYPLLCRRPKYIYETNTPGYNVLRFFFTCRHSDLCARIHTSLEGFYINIILASLRPLYIYYYFVTTLYCYGQPGLCYWCVAWRAFRLWTERVVIRHLFSLSLMLGACQKCYRCWCGERTASGRFGERRNDMIPISAKSISRIVSVLAQKAAGTEILLNNLP